MGSFPLQTELIAINISLCHVRSSYLYTQFTTGFFLFSCSPLQSNRPFLKRIFFGVSLEHGPLQKGRVNFQLAFVCLVFARSFCILGGLARGLSPWEILEEKEFCTVCCSALPGETNNPGNPTHPNSPISMHIQRRCFVGPHQHAAHIPPSP